MPVRLGSPNDLGGALAFLRWVVKGWTQQRLASESGVKLQSIKAIEQGVRRGSPETVGPILASLGFSYETLAEVRSLTRRLRNPEGGAQSWEESAIHPSVGILALDGVDLRREFQTLLTRTSLAPTVLKPLPLSRAEAPNLWARFQRCSEAGQLDLAREAAEFHSAGFVEVLCEESRNAAGGSAAKALHLARCAVLAAASVPGSPAWRSRLQGLAGKHVANALRVGGDLKQADLVMGQAAELWRAGAADDPGLLNAARVFHLEASLRREQRRIREALALLDQALELDRWGETPSLLMGKARALEELGQHGAAVDLLLRLELQLAAEGDSRGLYVVRNLLVSNLCHLGRHAKAAEMLGKLRHLARRLGNHLDLVRVDWLQGRVASGLGRSEDAITAFSRVRATFIAQNNPYDAALVTLQLAEVHAACGHTSEVKSLARESAPIFHDQGVHREARRALELFRQATEEERVSAELVRQILGYLYRSRHDADSRYGGAQLQSM
jgi:tetratricopeptide (TPR) repeat protein